MNQLLLMMTLTALPLSTFGAPSFQYDTPLVLDGTLTSVKSQHPNPQFGGKDQPALKLAAPITMMADDEGEFNVAEDDVSVIQLVYGKHAADFMRHNKGKRVIVACNGLFHAHTAHHTTDVLCDLKAISHYK